MEAEKQKAISAALLDLMVISEVMKTLGETGQDEVPTTWLAWFGGRVSLAADQVDKASS